MPCHLCNRSNFLLNQADGLRICQICNALGRPTHTNQRSLSMAQLELTIDELCDLLIAEGDPDQVGLWVEQILRTSLLKGLQVLGEMLAAQVELPRPFFELHQACIRSVTEVAPNDPISRQIYRTDTGRATDVCRCGRRFYPTLRRRLCGNCYSPSTTTFDPVYDCRIFSPEQHRRLITALGYNAGLYMEQLRAIDPARYNRITMTEDTAQTPPENPIFTGYSDGDRYSDEVALATRIARFMNRNWQIAFWLRLASDNPDKADDVLDELERRSAEPIRSVVAILRELNTTSGDAFDKAVRHLRSLGDNQHRQLEWFRTVEVIDRRWAARLMSRWHAVYPSEASVLSTVLAANSLIGEAGLNPSTGTAAMTRDPNTGDLVANWTSGNVRWPSILQVDVGANRAAHSGQEPTRRCVFNGCNNRRQEGVAVWCLECSTNPAVVVQFATRVRLQIESHRMELNRLSLIPLTSRSSSHAEQVRDMQRDLDTMRAYNASFRESPRPTRPVPVQEDGLPCVFRGCMGHRIADQLWCVQCAAVAVGNRESFDQAMIETESALFEELRVLSADNPISSNLRNQLMRDLAAVSRYLLDRGHSSARRPQVARPRQSNATEHLARALIQHLERRAEGTRLTPMESELFILMQSRFETGRLPVIIDKVNERCIELE